VVLYLYVCTNIWGFCIYIVSICMCKHMGCLAQNKAICMYIHINTTCRISYGFIVPICVYILVHVHTYICTYIYMYVHIYVHTYICTYTYMFIHIYVHTYRCNKPVGDPTSVLHQTSKMNMLYVFVHMHTYIFIYTHAHALQVLHPVLHSLCTR